MWDIRKTCGLPLIIITNGVKIPSISLRSTLAPKQKIRSDPTLVIKYEIGWT